MGKGTNNVGAGKRNVSASISDELYAELKKLAKGSGVGISTYITCILVHAAETALVLPNAKSMRHRAKNGGELQLPLKSSAPLGEVASLLRPDGFGGVGWGDFALGSHGAQDVV